jgi:glycosyltransferase involved in cell wall biosynthesis
VEEQSGILVSPASTDQLSSALIKLLANPDLVNEMSGKSYNIFKQRYDYSKNIDTIIELFNEACENSSQ